MPETVSPPRSLPELRTLAAAGGRITYLFFWGHQPRPDGSIGPGCLSQWWPAPFVVDGIRYATAEHYMMVGKARLFGDDAIAAQMLTAPHPGAVKALGRQVRGFDQAIWDARCFDLVVAGNVAKFSQHPTSDGTCPVRATGYWSRPARWIGSGASAFPPRTHAPTTRPSGAAVTSSGSR